MRKILIGGALMLAGLTVFAAGCGSGAASTTTATTPPSPAVKLVFITQPVGAAAGSTFDKQPVVAVEDAAGNIVTASPVLVELSVAAGDGPVDARLLGGTKIASVNGIAEFKSVSTNRAGTYKLTAAGGRLTPALSAPFSITPGPAAKLAFTAHPSGGIAGSPLIPQPVVAVQDSYGNTVTGYEGSVTLSATVTLPTGSSDPYSDTGSQTDTSFAAISGTTTVPVVDGVARFTDISATMSLPGYRLTAKSGTLESASSKFFEISPGAPAKLEFTVQPQGATAGIPFDTQPKVAIEDSYGNVVNSSRATISVSITPGSGTAGAALSGTTTLIAEDAFGGLAEFDDLSIDQAGSGYLLTATSSGLPPVTSQAFDVSSP
jgi:hypothetical protein